MVSGAEFSDLVAKCVKLLNEKSIVPPPDLVRQIENAICDRLPGYTHCKPCSRTQQTVGFNSIVRWVRAMYDFAVNNKFELVQQEVADARAKTCAACPMQIETSGCWGCKGIAGLLPHIAGAKTTPYDAQLKACGVCGCFNSVAVHMPVSAQGGDNLTFPDWCWKKG
jgi:hypothetical protein